MASVITSGLCNNIISKAIHNINDLKRKIRRKDTAKPSGSGGVIGRIDKVVLSCGPDSNYIYQDQVEIL
jgi:hypothetical protein